METLQAASWGSGFVIIVKSYHRFFWLVFFSVRARQDGLIEFTVMIADGAFVSQMLNRLCVSSLKVLLQACSYMQ